MSEALCNLDGSRDAIVTVREDRERAVAFVLDHGPCVANDARIHDLVVLTEQLGPGFVAESMSVTGGAFDVAEQERDSSRW